MRYLPEMLLVIGVLALAAAAWVTFGAPAAVAVVGVACIGIAIEMDRAGKRKR